MNRMVAMALSCGFVLAGFALPAQAQNEDQPERRRPQQRERDPEAMFKRLDKDQSGKLSKDEFLAMARNEEQKPRVEQLFARMDADKDGSVTLEEFKAGRPQRRDPAAAFKDLDKNTDGKLSKEEFAARAQTDEQKARVEQVFGRLDADKDGSLSLEEFSRGGRQRGERGDRGQREGDGERRRPQRDGDNN